MPEDLVNWFPAAVLAQPAPELLGQHPDWPQAYACLQLPNYGGRFYYHPMQRCLFWECAGGQL